MKIHVENAEHINIQDPRDIWEIIQRIFYQKKDEVDLTLMAQMSTSVP